LFASQSVYESFTDIESFEAALRTLKEKKRDK